MMTIFQTLTKERKPLNHSFQSLGLGLGVEAPGIGLGLETPNIGLILDLESSKSCFGKLRVLRLSFHCY